MLSKETFCEALRKIQAQKDRDEQFSKALTLMGDGHFVFEGGAPLLAALLDVLKEAELERDGLVYSQRTTGRFVTEDQAMIASAKRSLAERHIQAFLEAMTHLGYGREEILTLLRQEETKGGEDNGSSGM